MKLKIALALTLATTPALAAAPLEVEGFEEESSESGRAPGPVPEGDDRSEEEVVDVRPGEADLQDVGPPSVSPATATAPVESATTAASAATLKSATTAAPATYSARRETWNTYWERPRGLAEGDILVGFSLGGARSTGFVGVSVEALASNRVGIELAVKGGGVGHEQDRPHELRGDLDFFLGGRGVVPIPDGRRSVEDAFMHLETLAMTLHLGDGSGFDVVPSLGLSHFGYHVDFGGREINGGSGFLAAGMKVGWIHRRFFAGVDVGWHPVELFRYEAIDRRDAIDLEARSIGDAIDLRRFTASLMVGLSL